MSLLMLLLAGGNAEAKKYKPAPRTAKNIVIAHRGYWNTPGAFENSIKAIDNAMNFGIYGSEFDINFTADDSIVVVHGSKHPVVKDLVIQESTFDKVRNTLLGNGEKVPTLREYLLAGKSDPSTQLILEIKKHPTPERENEIVAKTMAMVEELGLEKRVEYISFSWNICEQIRKADRKAVVYYLNGEKSPAELKKAGMNGLDYSLKVIKKHPEWVKQAHDLGLKVNVWTVNKEEDMQAMLDLGVDFITTNNPVELKALIGKETECYFARRDFPPMGNLFGRTRTKQDFYVTEHFDNGRRRFYREPCRAAFRHQIPRLPHRQSR